MRHELGLRGLGKLLVAQSGVMVTLAGLFCSSSYQAGYSVLLGGLVCMIPQGLFAWLLFRQTGAQAVSRILKSFYLGEMAKIILTVLLFGVIFYCISVQPLALFAGFVGTQAVLWLSPVLFKKV